VFSTNLIKQILIIYDLHFFLKKNCGIILSKKLVNIYIISCSCFPRAFIISNWPPPNTNTLSRNFLTNYGGVELVTDISSYQNIL